MKNKLEIIVSEIAKNVAPGSSFFIGFSGLVVMKKIIESSMYRVSDKVVFRIKEMLGINSLMALLILINMISKVMKMIGAIID